MKKKFLYLLGIVLVASSLSACGNQTKTEVKEDKTVEETVNEENTEEVKDVDVSVTDYEIEAIPEEDLTAKEFAYYAALNIYTERFERDYALVGNAIDDFSSNDYIYYMDRLQLDIDAIDALSAPSSMAGVKDQLVKGLEKYKEASSYLHDAYDEVDYQKYEGFESALSLGMIGMSNAMSTSQNFYDFVKYYSALKETAYYAQDFNLFTKQDKFSGEENEALFTIDRALNHFAVSIDNTVLKYYSKGNYAEELANLDNIVYELKQLNIEDEILASYRDEIVECLSVFNGYFEEFFNLLSEDNIQSAFFKTSEIRENAIRLYDSRKIMQEFYESKGLTLEFLSSDNYVDGSTTYNIETDEDGNVVNIVEEESTYTEEINETEEVEVQE